MLRVTQLTVGFEPRSHDAQANSLWEIAMTANPSTPLKLGAWVFAVLWTAWMIWWSGSLDRVNIVMMSVCGAAVGYLWYLGMRWYFRRARMIPAEHDNGPPRRSLRAWLVWGALMIATGIATAWLVGLIDPLFPSGDWHWLFHASFIIVIWPALMWPLHAVAERYLSK
jgi:hypothetical protein